MNTPLFDARFLLALVLLAGFFTARTVIDCLKNGALAYAWKEYATLLACALVGAAFAAALDTTTSRIAPEYFTLGKGVVQDARFPLRVIARGVQSGFAAGAVLGATLLFVSGKKRPEGGPALPVIAAGVATTVALAGAFATGAAFLPGAMRPLRLDADTARTLGPAVTEVFDRVRTIHLGAYTGAMTGLLASAGFALRRPK